MLTMHCPLSGANSPLLLALTILPMVSSFQAAIKQMEHSSSSSTTSPTLIAGQQTFNMSKLPATLSLVT
jgi:hypothetical protein